MPHFAVSTHPPVLTKYSQGCWLQDCRVRRMARSLLLCLTQRLRNMIKGKTPEQIRTLFNIQNEYVHVLPLIPQ